MKNEPAQSTQDVRAAADNSYDRWIFWCESSSCRFSGAAEPRAALVAALRAQGTSNVAVVRSGCLGLCGAGPNAVTYPEGTVYLHADREHAGRLAANLARGTPDQLLAVKTPAWYREHLVARLGRIVEHLVSRLRADEARK